MGDLTVKEIENARPGDKDVFLYDGVGLQLRIYPSGKRAWQFRYRFGDKRRVMPLGSYEHVTLKDARKLTREARSLLDRGVDPIAHAQAQAEQAARQEEQVRLEQESRVTFRAAFNQWADMALSRRKDKGAETIRRFEKDVFPHIGERELGTVRRAVLLGVLDKIIQRDALVLANHVFGDLRQMFNWLESREMVEKHPLRGLKKNDIGGSQAPRQRRLSNDEVKLLRDQLPAGHLLRVTELAIWLMLGTACRVGELTRARWEDVDLDAGTWRIPPDNSKNSREHTVYMSEFVRRQFEALREITGWSGWCYPSTQRDGTHLCLRSISKQIKDRQRTEAMTNRSMKGLGALRLPGGDWTAHDLRRTAASLMAELGVAPAVIEKCLNHVEPSRLRRTYQVHEHTVEQKDAWARLGARLDEIINGDAQKVIPMTQSRKRKAT